MHIFVVLIILLFSGPRFYVRPIDRPFYPFSLLFQFSDVHTPHLAQSEYL